MRLGILSNEHVTFTLISSISILTHCLRKRSNAVTSRKHGLPQHNRPPKKRQQNRPTEAQKSPEPAIPKKRKNHNEKTERPGVPVQRRSMLDNL